jgi:lipoate-protein ligase A
LTDRWLLLLDGPASGAANMALDETLLWAAERQGLCSLRLYAWDPPTLSFGRNEPATRRYDRAAIASRGLATVRRPTGGRAVWHDREVTYAVTAPSDTFGSLQETYHEVHAMLAGALVTLGAVVSLAADRVAAPVGAGACFATAAGGEVVTAAGGKVVGSAQVRSGSAFLQHGSILLESRQDVVAGLTLGEAGAPHATGLAECLPPDRATFEMVATAVGRSARSRWHAPAGFAAWPGELRERALAAEARFRDDTWTWRR